MGWQGMASALVDAGYPLDQAGQARLFARKGRAAAIPASDPGQAVFSARHRDDSGC